MAHILITSGPTRQYLDPVRYLTNASSGRMGKALAQAALAHGHRVTVISGPVNLKYPQHAEVVPVLTTDEMLAASRDAFSDCDGLIGAAAPCDYRPRRVETNKITKTGRPLVLRLVETPDVVATLAANKKPHQWIVGFALETEDPRYRALLKMEKKQCDLMVMNGPHAINALENQVEVLDRQGQLVGSFTGSKQQVARKLLSLIQQLLVDTRNQGRE